MAKSKKQPAAKAAKQDKAAAPQKKPGANNSTWKPLLPALAGSLAVICLVFAALYWILILQEGNESQQQLAAAKAQTYLQAVTLQAQTLQHLAATTARSTQVKAAALSSHPDALENLERALKQQFPEAANVELFHQGKAQKNSQVNPPISFAQLDLIKRAENQQALQPEIHPYQQEKYLTVAAPIVSGNKILGSLMATYNLGNLLKDLPPVESQAGYLELTQTFANSKPLVFYSSGNKASKGETYASINGSISHWQAVFYADKSSASAARHSSLFFILWGCTLLLTAGAIALSHWLLRRDLDQNAAKLVNNFHALTNRSKPASRFSMGLFKSLWEKLEAEFSRYDTQVRKTQALKAQSKASNVEADILFRKDDVLDVDISDADSDLLAGASATAEVEEDPLAFLDEDHNDNMELDELELAQGNSSAGNNTVANKITARSVPAEIFRAYDIRGQVPDNLDAELTQAIGMAVGSEALSRQQTAVIVARDGRNSSVELAEALIQGLMASGVNVIDLGMLPTPMLYYATKTLSTQSGVMITGSHNPPEYNGFKVVIADKTLSGADIQALRGRVETGNLQQGKQGQYETQDINQDYKDRILNDVVLAKPIRLVIDCGNGVSGVAAAEIFKNLGCSVTTLYEEPDGNFPNHHPDPSKPENLQDLIAAVQEHQAELGIAFDGDGDRLGVVTKSGQIIWPDRLLMLYARDLLSRNPGSDIIYDVKCSRDLAEMVSNMGGRAIMCPTGHSLMKAKMAETGAAVGGELSGHIFFNDRWYGFDDAIYSAARLLEVLSMEPVEVEEVFAEFPSKPATPELNISIADDKKFKLMERLLEKGQFGDGNMITMDGIRVEYADGWGLIRASNTNPCLVARFEASSEDALEKIQRIFHDQLTAMEPGLALPF